MPLYGRALRIRERSLDPDDLNLAQSFSNLANLLFDMGRYEDALPSHHRALQIREKVLGRDHQDVAISLNGIASIFFRRSDFNAALPLFLRALQIREKAIGPESAATAAVLNNLSELFRVMDRYDEALPASRRALKIWEKILGPEHDQTATGYSNLANLLFEIGQYDDALPLYRRALHIREKKLGPEHPVTGKNLNQLANLLRDMGRYEDAMSMNRRSLQIFEKTFGPNHPDTASALNNLAGLLRVMGRHEEAMSIYSRALRISEKELGPDHPRTATLLNNLGGIFESMDRYDDALPLYQRALQINEKALGLDHSGTAISLNNLGWLFTLIGRYGDAMPLLRRALQINEKVLGPDHARTAVSLNNLAGLFRAMGRYDEALPLYRRALQVVTTSDITNSAANQGAIEHLSKFSANLAYFIAKHRPEPELDEAIFYYKLSVNTRQRMRAGTRDMDKTMRDSFTQQVADVYQELAKLLIQRGRLDEAERVLLMLKESDLTDYLRRNGSGPGAAGETLRWTGEEAKLHQDLQDIARSWAGYHTQWAEADKARKAGRIRDDGPEFAALDQRRQQLETKSDNLLKQASENFQAQSRAAAEKSHASFNMARTALAQKLSDIAQLDGQPSPRTAGLLLLPGERGLTMVVTTERGATALMVPVDTKTLGTLVLNLRTALSERGEYRPAAKALHAHLIAPAEQALGTTQAAEIRQWAVLPYGVLRNLPFSVLMDGSDRHLIERYALVAVTADGEGGLGNLDASPKPQWRSAGLGASIADSEFNNVALPGVRGELCGVVNDPDSAADCTKVAARGVLSGRRYLDRQFTADQLNRLMGTPAGTSAPTLLHIATHFSIDKSLLLLGDGDKLKLSQLVNWNPRLGHYDLIALSACDSGKSDEGVESLGGLLRRQGAKSVLATLWPIADVGAGPLMVEFYRQRGSQRVMAKSEALRCAQLAMLRGKLKNPDNPATDLRHPYFWAGYVLMGNWL